MTLLIAFATALGTEVEPGGVEVPAAEATGAVGAAEGAEGAGTTVVLKAGVEMGAGVSAGAWLPVDGGAVMVGKELPRVTSFDAPVAGTDVAVGVAGTDGRPLNDPKSQAVSSRSRSRSRASTVRAVRLTGGVRETFATKKRF
jgi:hypothetical protein